VNIDAMYQRGDTQHMLLEMNELRSQQIEIRGIAEMLWIIRILTLRNISSDIAGRIW